MEDNTVDMLGFFLGVIILGGLLVSILRLVISRLLLTQTKKELTSLISAEATAEEIADFCWRHRIGFSRDKFYKFSSFDPKVLGIAYGAILNRRIYHNGSLLFKYGNLTFLAKQLLLSAGKNKYQEYFLAGMASKYPDEAEQLEKKMGKILREEASEQVLQEA